MGMDRRGTCGAGERLERAEVTENGVGEVRGKEEGGRGAQEIAHRVCDAAWAGPVHARTRV